MDLSQITNIFSKPQEKLDWAEANSLWAIARNKLVGLATLEVYFSQATDNDLKQLMEMGIRMVAKPHIEKIIKLLHEEGLETPSVPGRTSLENRSRITGDITFLSNQEIAVSLREILRLAMYLSLRGIENAYRRDVFDLIWNILQEDIQGFKQTLILQKTKNWLFPPPGIGIQKSIGAKERMNWGEASGLWSIARDKLIKFSLWEIHLSQIEDRELKAFIEASIKKIVIPNLEKISTTLNKEGLPFPSMPGRTSLDLIGRDTGNLKWERDQEIALFMREQLRLVLYVDFEALIDTVRDDLFDLVWDIFREDVSNFRKMIEIQMKNNWALPSPSVYPEYKIEPKDVK